MNINPKIKLNLVFYAITLPLVPFVALMLLVAVILSPIPVIGNPFLNKVERLITKFSIWRNNLPVIKNAYDKVHLFDYLRG